MDTQGSPRFYAMHKKGETLVYPFQTQGAAQDE
jgi:hypothetical protein